MSNSSSAQLSPRILSAYERLDTALVHLKTALESQSKKVDPEIVEQLQMQVETLTQQNASLIHDLDQISSDDLENKCSSLVDENETLRREIETLQTQNTSLSELNTDISGRVQKLIGTVQHVLEEG